MSLCFHLGKKNHRGVSGRFGIFESLLMKYYTRLIQNFRNLPRNKTWKYLKTMFAVDNSPVVIWIKLAFFI
jgi:hypothetical protein